MKLKDLEVALKTESGQHTTNIFMPSIKRDVPFRPITTADVKTLSRIGVFNDFDLNNEMLKLSLFDKLIMESKESCGIDSETILPIDFLSFLIGVRRLLNNELSYTFTCKTCEKKFEETFDLEKRLTSFIFNYQRKICEYEKIDSHDDVWKFVLEDFTMKEYLYYRYYIDRLSQIDSNNPDVINEATYARPILYVKSISKNGEPIEDWNEHVLSDKIKLINMLPSEVIVDSRVRKEFEEPDPNTSLGTFIQANFDTEKMIRAINEMKVKCPHCGQEYSGVFKFDDFFMF